jgi:hypothetical protein
MSLTMSGAGTKILEIMADLYDAAETFTHALYGHAPPATILWPPPPTVNWRVGGFVLTNNELCATTDRGLLPIKYDPPLRAALPAGDHTLTATLDTDEYEAVPVTVTLTVRKAPAVIHWQDPAPVTWEPGGFELSEAELDAQTVPPGLDLRYEPPAGRKLPPADHVLTATLNEANYRADPVSVTLTVEKIRATIQWQTPGPVTWTPGGFIPGGGQLCATVSPPGAEIIYKQKTPGALPAGTHEITASLSPAGCYVAEPLSIDLVVRKLPVQIVCEKLVETEWTPGGYVLDTALLRATTIPPGIALTYAQDPPGSLPPGKYEVQITVADTVSCEAAPVTVTLKVRKAQAQIDWKNPEPVDYVSPGFVPGKDQLNAETRPLGLDLKYTWLNQGALPAGSHKLTASLDPESPYQCTPVAVTLQVRKVGAKLAWKAVASAVYVTDGYPLGDTELNQVDNPSGMALRFEPVKGTLLDPGEYTLRAIPNDPNFESAPATTKFVVKKAPATITWPQPGPIAWDDVNRATFGDLQRTATTQPDGLALIYTLGNDQLLQNGDALEPGQNKIVVSLDPAEIGYEARPVTCRIEVTQTEQQKERARERRRLAKAQTGGDREMTGVEQERERQRQRQREQNRQRAEALAQEDVPNAMLNAEYPIGAANVVPHIHSYPTGFHLKIIDGRKIRRIYLVINNVRTNAVAEALRIAWDYDVEHGTRLRKVLNALLEKF